jgi:kynurenine formamidase
VHPTHINDVATAIAFLKRDYGVKRWIGFGHSCGATMLCHYVSGIGLEGDKEGGPEGLILSAGIYNIPLFIRNHSPPACSEEISQIYNTIVQGAFGTDSSVYPSVSPVTAKYGKDQWKNGKLIVLAHSYDDELVERSQRDVMCVAFDREGWSIVMEDGDDEADVGTSGRVLEVRDIKGRHDFGWRDGEQAAQLILEVVERLT